MNFDFLKLRKAIKTPSKDAELDDFGFSKSELLVYDLNVQFYYTNIINSLILFTYKSAELKKMTPILIDPLTELYEELQFAFTKVCFETVFRNKLIEQNLKKPC